MAGNLPLTGGVELKLVWGQAGIPFSLNILHCLNTSGTAHTQARADSIDAAVKTAFTSSALGGQLGTTISLMRVESRSMTSNTDPWYVGSGAAVPGSGTGNILPLQVSFCVTSGTGLRGRSYKGRTYLAGFVVGANSATGTAVQAVADAATAFLNNIRTGLAGGALTLQLGVVSRFTRPPGTTVSIERNPPIITPITGSGALDLRWDTQRRRSVPGV